MKPRLSLPYDHTGDIIKINFNLVHAVALAVAGVWIWPSDPHWWGFYGVAIIMHASAVGLVIDAIRTMYKLKRSRDNWRAIQAFGNAPKNAKLATKQALQDKGMM